jgi:hypothetical protein
MATSSAWRETPFAEHAFELLPHSPRGNAGIVCYIMHSLTGSDATGNPGFRWGEIEQALNQSSGRNF